MKYQLGVGNPWQESNVFTGLSTGLQPSLGFIEISEGATICLQEDQIDNINISETSSVTDVTEPYFEVSESNAITYYYDEVVDNLDVYKTEFNSRAVEFVVEIKDSDPVMKLIVLMFEFLASKLSAFTYECLRDNL